jgi:hypothetical protein
MNRGLYILIFCLTACNPRKSGPVGAYKASSTFQIPVAAANNDSAHLVKIFKEGYWIAAVYGNRFRSMYSCGGGTYEAGSGKCSGSLDFFSNDMSMVGTKDEFTYTNKGNKYFESGYNKNAGGAFLLHYDEFEKIATTVRLKNKLMEGVWKIETGQVRYARMGDEYIKIYSYPRFAWAHYSTREKRVIAAGGGTYQFDGDIVTETLDYATYRTAVGTTIEWRATVYSKMKVLLYDIDSFYDEEVWTRIK